jgi:hypothetical protein
MFFHYVAPMETLWTVATLWETFQFTQDVAFLEEQVYPILVKCGEFIESLLHKDTHGNWYIYPTHSMEHHSGSSGFDRNGTATLALAQRILKAVIAAERILGVRQQASLNWEELLERLPNDYPRTRTQLGEIFLDCEYDEPRQGIYPPVQLPTEESGAGDSGEYDRNLRPNAARRDRPSKMEGNHGAWMYYNLPIPLFPVYPAGQIDADSPAEVHMTAERTWASMKLEGSNDIALHHLIAARLGIDSTCSLLNRLEDRKLQNNLYTIRLNKSVTNRDYLEKQRYFQYWRNGIYMENCGLSLVINEMMLQSNGGTIRLFPALNPYFQAEFHTLRTVGGFLVSAEYDRGFVMWVLVDPTVDGECRIRAPWPIEGAVLKDESGHILDFRTEENDIVFTAKMGTRYLLEPVLRRASE